MKKFDVVATLGTYEKDGQRKYVTRTVGAVIDTSKGLRLKLDATFNPAGCMRSDDGGVWLALFEPRAENAPAQSPAKTNASASYASDADFNDDIPF